MKTIKHARESLEQTTKIVKELMMSGKLIEDAAFIEFLDFWQEVYELDELLKRYNEDAEGVKRVLIYDTMSEEENQYD